MRKLTVFNNISIDGYFCDEDGDMSWAHRGSGDAEWNAFVAGNASGGGLLLFGRITYDMMMRYWPTPLAAEQNPVVAKHMNELPKIVFSRSLESATWSNTRLVKTDIEQAVRDMKEEPGPDMALMGSGSIVAQLAQAKLIDVLQVVVNPIVLGQGRTMFDGIEEKLAWKLTSTRSFGNGNVVISYVPG
jgi:dihydrofolate reductase